MTIFKKLTMICLALLTASGLCAAAACSTLPGASSSSAGNSSESSSTEAGESSSESSSSEESSSDDSSEETPINYVYRVKVRNATGFGFRGARVTLYDGEEIVAEKVTTSSGYATFGTSDIIKLGEYRIEVTDIPKGYELSSPDTVKSTVAVQGFETFVEIKPTGVIKETPPLDVHYSIGDVMYDFTAEDSDGNTFILSEVLKEKDAVLLNFWATWCGPCKAEFPAMNAAYQEYQDNVEILALSTSDSMNKVKEFKTSNGYVFPMTSSSECGANVVDAFNTSGIPVSVVVDRYGVIASYHIGSMTSKNDFANLFDRFIGEEYIPTILSNLEEDLGGGDSGDGSSLLVKPDADEFPDISTIADALSASEDFNFDWDTDDEYAWPWKADSVVEDGVEKKYIYAPIAGLHGNYATLLATFTASAGDAITFDYDLTTEEKCDILYVLIDGDVVQQLSGVNKSGTCGAYVFPDYTEENSAHEIIFIYLKDSDTGGEDKVHLSNLKLIKNASDDQVQGLVLRQAATMQNTAANKEGTATTLYQHYVDAVLGDDGYYHVGEKDGPILLANLMLASNWSEQSVWILAYNDFIIADGYNFHWDIEDYAWEANQPNPKTNIYGYTPVTQGLKELLDYAAKSEAVALYGYKTWKGYEDGNGNWIHYHEKEWLEMCIYYEAYGVEHMEDPMKGITFHAAIEAYSGTPENRIKNVAEITYAMNPRGFKYKFTPTQDGVYHIYSEGNEDTICFFVAEDQTTFLGIYEDVIGKENADGTPDLNFNFHYALEADKTYYLLLTTFLDSVTEYDFYIDYIGACYTYMENVAVGPYSFNEISGEMYLPDEKAYEYDEAEDAYYVVENGVRQGKIYVDMTRATVFFNTASLQMIAEMALEKYPDPTKRAFYIDGVDYTETIADYAFFADRNMGMLKGFAEMDKELFEIIVAITTSSKYEGLDGSWQMLCYYERTLTA